MRERKILLQHQAQNHEKQANLEGKSSKDAADQVGELFGCNGTQPPSQYKPAKRYD